MKGSYGRKKTKISYIIKADVMDNVIWADIFSQTVAMVFVSALI